MDWSHHYKYLCRSRYFLEFNTSFPTVESTQSIPQESTAKMESTSKNNQQPQAATAARARTNMPAGGICEPDPLDPDRVPCSNPVVLDDRQGISHFFGRNKRATSTIPTSCYPLQCRMHYQERKYRMKNLPGREAGHQCDAIAITLERMSKLTWTDDKGFEWPRWVGFELQKCHTKVVADDPDETMDDDDSNTKKKGKAKGGKAKTTRKRRRPSPPAPVPAWLEELCSSDALGQNHVHIGDRRGARYTFKQLAKIVRSIKSYCINTDARLPAVEALPVTVGLHAEAEVKSAKEAINAPLRLYNLAVKEVSDAKMRGKRIRQAEQERDEREAELEAARERYAEVLEDLEASKETLPVRRKPKKAAKKVEDDGDDDDEVEEVEPPKKRIRRTGKPKRRFVESDTDME